MKRMLACILMLLIGATAFAATKPDATEAVWLPFNGVALKSGERFLLKAAEGSSFEVAKPDVHFEGEKVFVRKGADTFNASCATTKSKFSFISEAHAADCHQQRDCPSGCASCIGLVRVCCGGGGTRGICLGAWGCP